LVIDPETGEGLVSTKAQHPGATAADHRTKLGLSAIWPRGSQFCSSNVIAKRYEQAASSVTATFPFSQWPAPFDNDTTLRGGCWIGCFTPCAHRPDSGEKAKTERGPTKAAGIRTDLGSSQNY